MKINTVAALFASLMIILFFGCVNENPLRTPDNSLGITETTPMSSATANCTRSDGYWKTHSKYGPAGPRDDTWDSIGEDTNFFTNIHKDGTPMTWYSVMWIPPRKANAYIVLAHKYVGAQLNFLAGADPTDVFIEFGQATGLLSVYTWDYNWRADPDGVRDTFITLAMVLDDYNNGVTGPGYCDDSSTDREPGMIRNP